MTIREHNGVGKVTWKAEPDAHDYPAAASYLSLIAPGAQAGDLVGQLQTASLEHYKAKDMLRASGLPLLPPDNPHVAADLAKVKNNKALSPVLLIRGDLTLGIALQIADGYHRVCASYHLDENTDIPCRIADHPGSRVSALAAAVGGDLVNDSR
ncbi:MAG: hypothetical protein JO309_06610 [Pseudonocardiales bacterium]|nr:hypothetical protein [Pseudonocardiales bacterium]MBV9729068.1 hypothetical protein [Pseudonocardiales bacterium]